MKKSEQNLALDALREAEWLQDYAPALAENLVSEGHIVRLNTGEWAQAEGDDRAGLYLVIDGCFYTYYAPLGDRVIMVGLAEPGAVLGHTTRYSGGPRLVTAVCAEPSIVLEISENALDRVATQSPEIWRAIADISYNNMRRALRLAAEIVSLRPRERIAARLLAITKSDPTGELSSIKISQELLGEMTGVTRKTINQHLSSLEREGVIRVGYGHIQIVNRTKLKLISASERTS